MFRTSDKMLSTYVLPGSEYALADVKGRIHASFWLASATGRTRSSGPNLQNFPSYPSEDLANYIKETFPDEPLNIRENIVADKGRTLIIADYSQIELRAVAHISDDPLFIKAYRDYECTACGAGGKADVILHACPKCGIEENEAILKNPSVKGFWHGLDLHQMTTDKVSALHGDRQCGKMCNFALVYFATARRMHFEYPSFSIESWQKIIDEYFSSKGYEGVRTWHEMMETRLYAHPVVRDIFGRKRRIIKRVIQQSPKNALNMFINFGPQATALGIIFIAMKNLRALWVKEGVWLKNIFMINFIHDEIVFECDEDMTDKFEEDIRREMESCVQLKVPLRADIQVSSHWGVKG